MHSNVLIGPSFFRDCKQHPHTGPSRDSSSQHGWVTFEVPFQIALASFMPDKLVFKIQDYERVTTCPPIPTALPQNSSHFGTLDVSGPSLGPVGALASNRRSPPSTNQTLLLELRMHLQSRKRTTISFARMWEPLETLRPTAPLRGQP
jgi:hypothetical protein